MTIKRMVIGSAVVIAAGGCIGHNFLGSQDSICDASCNDGSDHLDFASGHGFDSGWGSGSGSGSGHGSGSGSGSGFGSGSGSGFGSGSGSGFGSGS